VKKPIKKHGKAAPSSAPLRKVLLLDDDLDLCDILKTVIGWHRYEVTVVHRGVEGVRAIMERDYDAIVCDIMMPNMPGDMFYLAVQQLKPHLCKRFVFITGHEGNPAVNAFLKLASGFVLFKPLATDQLILKIGQVVATTDASVQKIMAAVQPDWPDQKPAPVIVAAETPKAPSGGPRLEIQRLPSERDRDVWVG
jgi:CheY-like chemotaxis protein